MFVKGILMTAGLAAGMGMLLPAAAQDQPGFGGEEDTSYAATLWSALEEADLAGAEAVQAKAYEGTEPHGAILQTLWDTISVDGQDGMVIVKRNFGPAGVTIEDVANDPAGNLASVTVMFQRAEGYAPDSDDWFWAKYLPDGSLDQSPDGVALAGKVGGCISCHEGAEGDFVFTFDF